MQNLVSSFDLVPGVVIEFLGQPAIVTSVSLDCDTEVATVTLNTPRADYELGLSWAVPNTINVIGLAQNCEPDNLVLFNS